MPRRIFQSPAGSRPARASGSRFSATRRTTFPLSASAHRAIHQYGENLPVRPGAGEIEQLIKPLATHVVKELEKIRG